MPGIESEQERNSEYQALPVSEKKAVTALTYIEEIARPLRAHFGHPKPRKKRGSPEVENKESTNAENWRLFEVCLSIRALPGRILLELWKYHKQRTGEEDRHTFNAAILKLERLEFVDRQDEPDDRRKKGLVLTPAGETAVETVMYSHAQMMHKLWRRKDFHYIESDPQQLENMKDDYNDLALTDAEAIRLMRGEPG
jgi:hypothetical protein